MECRDNYAFLVIDYFAFLLLTIMYCRLNGTLPFDADDLETIVEQTVLDDLELEGRFWQNVSPEAKDLLTNLLRKDPSERISVKEALQHPWIKV